VIIRYPTGLYSKQIPQDPEDAGNVTFTISNEEPDIAAGNFIIYPIAEKLRKRSSRSYTDEQRRKNLGDLVYTVSTGGNTIEGRSTKLFEIGQILEFTDIEQESSDLNAVSDKLEIQHNTNVLDLSGLGLSEAEIAIISTNSAAVEKELENQLTALLDQIADTNAMITDTQKTINEANKAISALSVLGNSDDIIKKIEDKRNAAIVEQSTLMNEKDSLNQQLTQVRDQIYAISQLVR